MLLCDWGVNQPESTNGVQEGVGLNKKEETERETGGRKTSGENRDIKCLNKICRVYISLLHGYSWWPEISFQSFIYFRTVKKNGRVCSLASCLSPAV